MSARESIKRSDVQDIFALTPLQEGILFHYLRDPGNSDLYFEQLTLRVNGNIDVHRFERAWEMVIETNEMLRTVFRWEKVENPTQVVLKRHQLQLIYFDISVGAGEAREKTLDEIAAADRRQAFDLKEVPFRVTLCKMDESAYAMIISNHHILYDGWSTGIILKEFLSAYESCPGSGSLTRGTSAKTPFKEYIRWLRQQGEGEQETFWKDYLAGTEADISTVLPVKRKEARVGEVKVYHASLAEEEKTRLERFLEERKITLAALLYSGWGIVLQNYTDNSDVFFGAVLSGRSANIKGIEDMVGLFINTLPVRVKHEAGETAADVLIDVNRTLQQLEFYEGTPLVKIKQFIRRDENSELFDSLLVVENYPLDIAGLSKSGPLTIDSFSMVEATHYDLTLVIRVSVEAIGIDFVYRETVFEGTAVETLARHFNRILKEIVTKPDRDVYLLDMLSGQEKQVILEDFNRTQAEFPTDKTIHRLFEEQVERNPGRVAVKGTDTAVAVGAIHESPLHHKPPLHSMSYTYRQLNIKAGQVAEMLKERGTTPGAIVAVMLERSPEMVAGILGILKAGAAYLPVDPGFPAERIRYMLQDSGARLVVGAGLKVGWFDGSQVKEFSGSAKPANAAIDQPVNFSTQPAYVIYTSGSTGLPKGVLIEHRSVVNLLFALYRLYPFTSSDTYLFKTSFLFDVSVSEIFGWYMGGGCLAVLGHGAEKDPQVITNTVESANVTHINFIPSQFNVFLEWLTVVRAAKMAGLKYIFLAGEALLPETVERFRRLNLRARLENLYGPTEATVYASGYSLAGWDSIGAVPIGKPLDNTAFYILDKQKRVQTVGVPGELCIAGAGLARGYLNRPELTAEKFILRPSSFVSGDPNDRLYRTGDLARWLPDGNVEYLGRIDQQVKIRGYRIEPGEIENRLMGYEGVEDTVVIARTGIDGDNYLCAYVVPGSPGSLETGHLEDHLREKLPTYMVPAYFVFLEQLPKTATGKVDRRSLPDPGPGAGQSKYAAPRNRKEELLVTLWEGLLNPGSRTGRISVGIDDNFFQLGGHSLLATRLIARIQRMFDTEVQLSVLFDNPTIRGIGAYLESGQKHAHHSIEPVEEKEYYKLSLTQKRFYVFQQLEPTDISYNIPEIMRVEGKLRADKLEKIVKDLVVRHESLRTSFHQVLGEPVQRIHAADSVDFANEWYEAGEEDIAGRFVRPFDLSRPPLLRLGLVELGDKRFNVMFDIHHIISDGTSLSIFIKEFLALYNGLHLPPLRVRYRDFVEWQAGTWSSRQVKEKNKPGQAEEKLVDKDERLNLPTDYTRPAVLSSRGDTLRFYSGVGSLAALKAFSLKQDVTLYMVVLSLFKVFLARISGQDKITVGSPIAGREHSDLDNIIGLFINTLVLKSFPCGEKKFTQYLEEVKEVSLAAFEYQDFQYDELLEQTDLKESSGRNPLFDVMFVMQNMDMPTVVIPGMIVTLHIKENTTSKFDMTFYCEEKDDQLEYWIEYSTDLFKRETVERFSRYFNMAVFRVLENPSRQISNIELITHKEKRQILYDFNNSVCSFPGDKTIYQVFEEQVRKSGSNIAVIGQRIQADISGDTAVQEKLSYTGLNSRANRLARCLRERGVGRGTVTGIMSERSIDMVVGLLAILKAGGTYLPIDPEYPERRISTMLDHSRSEVLLSHSRVLGNKSLSSTAGKQCLLTDQVEEETGAYTDTDLEPLSGPEDLIYIIFTSGSTGTPKGAGVYHRGFMNLMHWFNREFDLSENDSNLLVTSLSFDLTQKNLYSGVMTGGKLCMPGVNYFEPRTYMRAIREYGVTWINCTPSMFVKLVEFEMAAAAGEKRLSTLRYVFLGGEPIPMTSLVEWLESDECSAVIVNTYGPTECTDICASFRLEEPRRFLRQAVPVGKPVYNVRLFIPDRNMLPLPVGIPGELWIGGDGVGIGYVNDDELTGEKFMEHSFIAGEPGQRFYRTGDLVKWLPDGNIEFLGRIDHQVKVRGFRIELGEIENQLAAHPTVKETLVMARDTGGGDKNLCAYVVPRDKGSFVESELRDHLSAGLPEYMVPAYFIELEKMPLNPNGKIDRKALPEPDIVSGRDYVPPRSETEKLLAGLWARVLGINSSSLGIHDSFFKLGGHSLKAASLIGEIHKTFSVEIPIAELFETPTVAGASRYIDGAEEALYYSVEAVECREYYPLSSAQKRIFIIQQMDLSDISYNLPEVMKVTAQLDREHLAAVFRHLILRHETLRTSFPIVNGEPVQRVHRETGFEIEHYEDTTGEFVRPFDLSQPPLLRVALRRLEEQEYLLAFDMHHIVSDAVSMNLMIREFVTLYKGEELPPLRIQYKDFSIWQNRLIRSGKVEKQETYWFEAMAGEVPVLELPLDFTRPPVKKTAGRSMTFDIEAKVQERLKKYSQETSSTPFMVLLAVFGVLLAKLSGQEDTIVGSPAAGRSHRDVEHLIGIFINTLALRSFPLPDKSFSQLLEEVKQTCLKAQENQDYQYEELVEKIVSHRDLSRSALFDVMFVMQNVERQVLEIPGLKLEPYDYERTASKFDFTLTVVEGVEGFEFSVTYSTVLFREETVLRFIEYYKRILTAALEDSSRRLWEIDILSQAEKNALLYDLNPVDREYPGPGTLHRLFEDQAARTPDVTALVGRDCTFGPADEESRMTFRELNRRANSLARFIKEKGVIPDTICAILTEPSLEMIIGILAVLKAGGAYLPVEPGQPVERIQFMLKDSRALLMLTPGNLSRNVSFDGPLIILDEPSMYEAKDTDLPHSSGPSHLLYTIFTSGTTGKSKGALLENRNLVNYVNWFGSCAGLSGEDATVLTSSFGFDLGYTSIFPSLVWGCRLHIIPRETYLSPEELLEYIAANKVTYIKVTPSLFTTIVESPAFSAGALATMRLVVMGGEAIRLPEIEKLHAAAGHVRVINHYGPTEATIGCVAQYIDFNAFDIYREMPTIGSPVDNMKVVILDHRGNLVPVGVAGELCVYGDGVARGYLNRPELTAEKFLSSPVTRHPSPLYRTGDRARWLSSGMIQFLGRIDTQIKIRGYRIELGEIERRLSSHEAIKEAAVIDREHSPGNKYLCAYIVPDPGGEEVETQQLKEFLARELPDYMLPSYIITLDAIPLTANGKLNRKMLTEPPAGIEIDDYEAPDGYVQEKLAELWQELPGMEGRTFGVHDNFFHLGGHSLTAIMMASKIHKTFDIRIPLGEIFKKPTIKGMAEYISQAASESCGSVETVEKREYYALSSSQKRLHLLHKRKKDDRSYNISLAALLEGKLDIQRSGQVFKDLIHRHESLRTSFEMVKGEPVQRVHEEVSFEIGLFRATPGEQSLTPDQGFYEETTRNFVRPFDLTQAPLIKIGLTKIHEDAHLLMVDLHHIISDGVSRGIFIREFMALYNEEELSPVRIQYKDYTLWQNRRRNSNAFKQQEAYWSSVFEDNMPVLQLPFDHPGVQVRDSRGGSVDFAVNSEETGILKAAAKEENVTPFMILLAVYNLLLSKLSGQDDIVVGIPVAGRWHADLQDTIGMFVNTIALRSSPREDISFREYLEQLKRRNLEAFENQEYLFEDLVNLLGEKTAGDMGRNPLFDVVFLLQNQDVPDLDIPGLVLKPVKYKHLTAKFDLALVGIEDKGGLSFTFEYREQLFKRETVERFTGYFKDIITAVLSDRDILLGDIAVTVDLSESQSAMTGEVEGDFGF
jgi:amino acid adenylation domain-containing protein